MAGGVSPRPLLSNTGEKIMDKGAEKDRLIIYLTERNQYLSKLHRLSNECVRLKEMVDNCNYKIRLQKKLLRRMEVNNGN